LGRERLNLAKDRITIAHPRDVILTRKLDVLDTRNPIGQIPTLLGLADAISGSVQDERRNADGR